MKALLAGLTGVHSGKGVFAINAAHKASACAGDQQAVDDIEAEHPVVCAHPATGRPLRVRHQRAQPLQGHDRGREQADHRLPGRAARSGRNSPAACAGNRAR